jgi:hypothetical protein
VWFSAIVPLLATIFGDKGPIGQYFATKAQTIKAEELYRLEVLKSQTEAAKADVQQTSDRLQATTQDFKQSTFWFICVPIILTVCPWTTDFAVVMWGNFKLIPEWFQILFVSVYSAIWGLPLAKEYLGGMFKSLGNAVEARREYKARINRVAVFADLTASLGGKMDQRTIDMVNKAINAGDDDPSNDGKTHS